MPQRKFRMHLYSRNVQTTAYPRSQKELFLQSLNVVE